MRKHLSQSPNDSATEICCWQRITRCAGVMSKAGRYMGEVRFSTTLIP